MKKPEIMEWLHMALAYRGDECLEWPFARAGSGHGIYRNTSVTRFICGVLAMRPLIHEEDACHHCDNPPCCNPMHLFIGSRADNMQDAARKGRLNRDRYERRWSKLTPDQVRAARKEYAAGGISYGRLAKKHGVNKRTMRLAVTGESFKDVC